MAGVLAAVSVSVGLASADAALYGGCTYYNNPYYTITASGGGIPANQTWSVHMTGIVGRSHLSVSVSPALLTTTTSGPGLVYLHNPAAVPAGTVIRLEAGGFFVPPNGGSQGFTLSGYGGSVYVAVDDGICVQTS